MARILIYAQNYAPEPTGVGRYTGEIGAYLAAQGHAVRVVTALPHYPGWAVTRPYRAWRYAVERRDGVDVLRCPILLGRPMRGLWRLLAPLSFAVTSLPALLARLLRERPDVLFCVEPTLFAAPVAVLLGRLLGARTVLHVQDLEVEAAFAVGHLKGRLARTLAMASERWLLRRFDRLIAISERMRRRLAEKGVPDSRIALVRNWVDLEAVRPLPGPNGYRREFGWPETKLVALYAGSVGAKQALHVALDAAEQLAGRDDLLFLVVGDGPAKAALVARYGERPNIRFLPPQPEHRMCDLLNLADIHLLTQARGIADLVLPSKLGGMLASGKPVLVTADEDTELFDVLQGTAIIVPPGDSRAIARELALFADRAGSHPRLGDGRSLLHTMARPDCLRAVEAQAVTGLGA